MSSGLEDDEFHKELVVFCLVFLWSLLENCSWSNKECQLPIAAIDNSLSKEHTFYGFRPRSTSPSFWSQGSPWQDSPNGVQSTFLWCHPKMLQGTYMDRPFLGEMRLDRLKSRLNQTRVSVKSPTRPVWKSRNVLRWSRHPGSHTSRRPGTSMTGFSYRLTTPFELFCTEPEMHC